MNESPSTFHKLHYLCVRPFRHKYLFGNGLKKCMGGSKYHNSKHAREKPPTKLWISMYPTQTHGMVFTPCGLLTCIIKHGEWNLGTYLGVLPWSWGGVEWPSNGHIELHSYFPRLFWELVWKEYLVSKSRVSSFLNFHIGLPDSLS